jgi:hypothetical protein
LSGKRSLPLNTYNMVTLCFDFGNSRLKAAVFNNDQLQETVVLPNDEAATMEGLMQQFRPQKTLPWIPFWPPIVPITG